MSLRLSLSLSHHRHLSSTRHSPTSDTSSPLVQPRHAIPLRLRTRHPQLRNIYPSRDVYSPTGLKSLIGEWNGRGKQSYHLQIDLRNLIRSLRLHSCSQVLKKVDNGVPFEKANRSLEQRAFDEHGQPLLVCPRFVVFAASIAPFQS